VSLDASSQDVKTVLSVLADMAGVDIVVDDTLIAKVTVRLSAVPFEQAMAAVARAAGATVIHEDGPYLILNSRSYYQAPSTPSEQISAQVIDLSGRRYEDVLPLIQAFANGLEIESFPDLQAVLVRGPYTQVNTLKSTIDAYLRSQPVQSGQPKTLRVVRLAYADVSEVAMSLQGQFPSLRVVSLRASNTLMISGSPDEVDIATRAVDRLDEAPALIAFDVEVVEVNSDDLDSVGFDWTGAQGRPALSVTFQESAPRPTSEGSSGNLLDFRPWVRASLEFSTQIRLLARDGHAKILARPSLVTLENRTARILTGDRYTIVLTQPGTGWQQTQYIDAGVRLELKPVLDKEGKVIVSLIPQVSAVTGFSREGYPIMSTREASTTVRLEDGETLVIGGLMRTESTGEKTKVPLLGEIPLLGVLFTSGKENTKTTELMILVTPHIVRDTAPLANPVCQGDQVHGSSGVEQ